MPATRRAPRTIRREVGDASTVVVGDISTVSGAMDLADQVSHRPVDAVIHNAGVGYGAAPRPTLKGTRASSPSTSWRRTSLRPGSAARAGWSISAPASTGRRRACTTSSGGPGAGTGRGPIRRASSRLRHWPLPSHATGPMSSQCGRSGLGPDPHGKRRCSGRSRKRLRYPSGSRHFERANFRRAHWAVPLPYGGAAA